MAKEREKIVDEEIMSLKERIPSQENLQLVTCVPELVRVQIKLTEHKQLSVCLQFPTDYPHAPILIELKSKTLGDHLLSKLTKICEEEAKNRIGQMQVMTMVKFLRQFLIDNPLCSCSDEIAYLKQKLINEEDDFKLKQKTSQIIVKLKKNKYFMNLRFTIPENYPTACVKTEVIDSNFPKLLRVNFQSQADELARRCVQPPIRKNPKAPAFTIQPSLRKVCDFIIKDSVKRYPDELCPLCKERCLPEEPQAFPDKSKTVIRVYCSHIFHYSCMDTYMKTPPFKGGKKCPSCDSRIYHDKWNSSPELAEERWAHKEARSREIDEVTDFLK